MKKILWVGDGPDCPSGFGLATKKILEAFDYRYGGGDYDVTVLGINYIGDPGTVPYPVYAALATGDGFGVNRLVWMCDRVRPDLIIIQQDGWNFQSYIRHLRSKNADGGYNFPEHASIPIVAVVAVDGKNFNGKWLDGVAHAIFWTKFAENEARLGGYKGPSSVIPLGVDLETYFPMDTREARKARFNMDLGDAFIVGNVNRNQPRKRWDLTVKYFAKWVQLHSIPNAYLFLHAAPTGDGGVDVKQLAQYYGIADRLIFMEPQMFYGVSEEVMRVTYNCFDVQISTTQGEGFGLTTFEGMACGVPQIVPDWSALGELCEGAARLVPCTSTAIGAPYVNVIGGVMDESLAVNYLHSAYVSQTLQKQFKTLGIARVNEDRFRWSTVGRRFAEVACDVLETREGAWSDLGRQEVAL